MLFNRNFALVRAKKASGLEGGIDGWLDRKLERQMDGCLIFNLPYVLQAFDTFPKKSIWYLVDFRLIWLEKADLMLKDQFEVSRQRPWRGWSSEEDRGTFICQFVCLSIHLFPSSGLPGLISGLYGLKSALSGFKSALPSLKSALSSLKFSISSLSSALAGFLGSDPKGPMSCKTQGGISRRPSFLWSVRPSGWPLGRLPGGSNLVKF